jgi:hypothetical protein
MKQWRKWIILLLNPQLLPWAGALPRNRNHADVLDPDNFAPNAYGALSLVQLTNRATFVPAKRARWYHAELKSVNCFGRSAAPESESRGCLRPRQLRPGRLRRCSTSNRGNGNILTVGLLNLNQSRAHLVTCIRGLRDQTRLSV